MIDRYRAMMLLETPSGRTRVEALCRDLLQRDLQNDMMTIPPQLLFLLGKSEEAIEAARNYLPSILVSKYWEFPRDSLLYLGGLISEDEYLERGENSARDRGCAHFDIGVRRLASGDRAGAREHFEKAAASTVFHWGPMGWSRVFAARMARDPDWPNWLPVREDDGAKNTTEPGAVNRGDE